MTNGNGSKSKGILSESKGKERIGVYVCHCGSNIAGIVDVQQVAEWAASRLKHRGVLQLGSGVDRERY